MAGIRGLGTAYPCPVCLVPKKDLALHAEEWEYRNALERRRLGLIVEDEKEAATSREKAAKALEDKSFRPMTVCPTALVRRGTANPVLSCRMPSLT